ncbi:MAG: hypothetical protein J7K26_03860 [Candidatus Aenigmarchaeota archaeon]|nr:hypothetical protein [Candidatus Aenigmarchaeota archaeon]
MADESNEKKKEGYLENDELEEPKEKVPSRLAAIGKQICPKCGAINPRNKLVCIKCGAFLPKAYKKASEARYESAEKWKSRFGGFGEKIKEYMHIIIIPIILGIIAILFGFIFFGSALFLIGFYFAAPYSSYARGPLKLFILSLIYLEFTILHPQILITLIVLFIGYFSMPTGYRESRKYKAAEAWGRIFIGYLVAITLYSALGGATSLYVIPLLTLSPIQAPLFLISFAFFFVLPEVKPEGGSINIYMGLKGIPQTVAGKSIGAIIFVTIMSIALLFILNSWKLAETSTFTISIFWILSLIMGLLSGREGRPYTGIIMLGIALLMFSVQFTGVVGTNIFGPYWPTVEHYTSAIIEPINNAIENAASGAEDAWLMITCPQCYQAKQQKMQQIGTGRVKPRGTVRSIELSNFNAINYGSATPIIDPALPLIGTIELSNKGEFTGRNIKVKLGKDGSGYVLLKDPQKTGAAYDTSVYCDPNKGKECTYTELEHDLCTFTSCLDSNEYYDNVFEKNNLVTSCTWDESLPGDLKMMTFKCGDPSKDYSKWTDLSIFDPNAPPGYEIYLYGQMFATILMEYEFDYDVNTSLGITIMDTQLFIDKLSRKEIIPKEETSVYTGGPVQLNIWTPKQPLRDMEESYIRISGINKEDGVVEKGSELIIKIPAENIPFESRPLIVSNTGLETTENKLIYICNDNTEVEVSSIQEEESACSNNGGVKESYYEITGTLSNDLNKNDLFTILLSFKYYLPDQVDEKSFIPVATFTYTYKTDKKIELQIANAPITGAG